jgi:isocitrate/isopropylmalate dehydrogenase
VIEQAVRVLQVVSAASTAADLELQSYPFGGCAIDEQGEPLPASTLEACKEADAILMGARSFYPSFSELLITNRATKVRLVALNGASSARFVRNRAS